MESVTTLFPQREEKRRTCKCNVLELLFVRLSAEFNERIEAGRVPLCLANVLEIKLHLLPSN